jgi:REP element-mobilizing transposase RayT
MTDDSLPQRRARSLSHIPPSWVPAESLFFITINCARRGEPQLTKGEMPERIFSSVSHYHQRGIWWPEILLLMPDHLHALISFSWNPKAGMNSVIANWKRYTAREYGIEWQRDFFDHRIRNAEDHEEKWRYIRDNPQRAGLVSDAAQWPYVWFPERTGWSDAS